MSIKSRGDQKLKFPYSYRSPIEVTTLSESRDPALYTGSLLEQNPSSSINFSRLSHLYDKCQSVIFVVLEYEKLNYGLGTA